MISTIDIPDWVAKSSPVRLLFAFDEKLELLEHNCAQFHEEQSVAAWYVPWW